MLGVFFNTRLLKGSAPWRHDKDKSHHLGRLGQVPHYTMEASMRARSICSGHTLVRRFILVSFLLFPWPVLAEEGAALPLSKIMLYSSGVGYFQHDGTVNNRTQLDLRMQCEPDQRHAEEFGRAGLRWRQNLDRHLRLARSRHQDARQLRHQSQWQPDPGADSDTGPWGTGRSHRAQSHRRHVAGRGKENRVHRRGLSAPDHRAGVCHDPDRRRVPLTLAGERAAHQIDQSRVEC